MSYSDWDPDEYLNFDYGKPVPDERRSSRVDRYYHEETPKPVTRPQPQSESRVKPEPKKADFRWSSDSHRDYDEDIRQYERLRQQSAEEIIQQAKLEAQEEVYEKYTNRKSNKKSNSKQIDKSGKKGKRGSAAALRNKNTKLYKFSKVLSLFYIIALGAFAFVMMIMNILPFYMLIALYIVLGLLSFIIVIQLTKNNIKRWAKVLSTTLAIILIFVYGMGCVYALGTLSFLDKTSVENENRVGSVTKEPFNVLITGMDVWGKVDEQGRSDVNMLVTVNPQTETILMTSVPRDYEIRMPDKGYATDKLTHTGFYSVDTTIQAVEDLLNCETNYYVKVNFTTIVKFIDAIGGIDLKNKQAFKSAISDNYYEEGMIHLNGKQSLYYARERKAFLEGDNQRVRNQQQVFAAMLKKAMSSKTMVLSYNKVLTELDDYFEMSFSSREIRALMRLQLAKSPDWKMHKYAVIGGGASMSTYTTGSAKCYVMTQDPTSIANASQLIQAVLDGKKLKTDKDGMVTIVEETTEETAEDAA